MNNNILSLLGLALRGGRLAVGEEPAALAARGGQARLLLLASDAADNTLRRAEHLAGEGHCLWLVLPFSKAELGGALGRGSAAIAALTDVGLAAAVAERLAALDSERYGEIARRLVLKRRRAKERQSAPHRPPPPPEERQSRRPPKVRPRGPSRRDGPGETRHGSRPQGEGRPGGGRAPHHGGPGRSLGDKPGRTSQGKPSHPHFERPGRAASNSPGGSRLRNGARPGGEKRRPPNHRGGSGRGGGR